MNHRRLCELSYRIKSIYLHAKHNKDKRHFLFACFAMVLLTCCFCIKKAKYLATLDALIIYEWMITILAIILLLIFVFIGRVISNLRYQVAFQKIGLVNKFKEPPIFLFGDIHNGNIITMLFISDGIPLSDWITQKEKLENVLNMSISDISFGGNSHEICITGCKGLNDFKTNIYLDKADIDPQKAVFYLGETMGIPITVSIDSYAHILIGGATGSGKTYLLRLLLFQSIIKNYQVIICDFKGGLDYSSVWRESCNFVTTEQETLQILHDICGELEKRKHLFSEEEAKDIDIYVKKTGHNITRIIFACDELAELLSLTGLSKEEKEIIKQIEKYLATIARLGRAFGIHLILATQRPDADVLSGQIKAKETLIN